MRLLRGEPPPTRCHREPIRRSCLRPARRGCPDSGRRAALPVVVPSRPWDRHGAGRGAAGAAAARGRELPRGRRGLLPRHGPDQGWSGRVVARRSQGAQHVDRLVGRQRCDVGHARRQQRRRARLPEGAVVAPVAEVRPPVRPGPAGQRRVPEPLGVLRPRERAVLRGSQPSRREPQRAVARPANARLRARPVRKHHEVPRRGAWLARHECQRREVRDGLLLRLCQRHRRLPLLPEPEVRRGRGHAVGPGALLHRSVLLQRQDPGAAVSRGHVVRFVPRGPESDQAPGRSEQPGVGQPERQRRRAVFLDRSHLLRSGGVCELRVSVVPLVSPGVARHVVCLERQHQQPAHHERGLRPAAAPAECPALG